MSRRNRNRAHPSQWNHADRAAPVWPDRQPRRRGRNSAPRRIQEGDYAPAHPIPASLFGRARAWLSSSVSLRGWRELWGTLLQPRGPESSTFEEAGWATAGMGLASLLNALDWENVRAEVDRESRAHVVLIGAQHAGKSTLLDQLKGFAAEEAEKPGQTEGASQTEGIDEPRIENLGFFAVIDLPECSPDSHLDENSALGFELENADLVVWLLDGAAGLRAWEYEWLGRVRAMGKTLLVVLNKLDLLPAPIDVEPWQKRLGCEIIPIAAREGTNVMEQLLPRLADAGPQLATALGREVAGWRRMAAQRVMRRAATLSGLTGLEPVPLLDIPFQILIQLQLVLRIAAIYGQPLNDRYSREMLATLVSGVALRYAGQQLAKLIPLAGWVASGMLAAGGTWAIGQLAAEYFEHGRRVPRPELGHRFTRIKAAEKKEKRVASIRLLDRVGGWFKRMIRIGQGKGKESREARGAAAVDEPARDSERSEE